MAVKKIWRTLSKISLGVVLVLIWGWMYLRADLLFPANTEAWKDIIQTYIIFTALIFSWDTVVSKKTEEPLFRVGFLKAFPKFLLWAGIGLGVLLAFGLIYQGEALPSIYEAISNVGIGVILLHAFFVATLEEKVFRAWLPNQLRSGGMRESIVWFIAILVFAFFHYLMNGEWLTLLIYLPLGYIFMYVRKKYSPKTDMANSGLHFAWNLFILGFLVI